MNTDIRYADHAVNLMWARADHMDSDSISYGHLLDYRSDTGWDYIVPMLVIRDTWYGDYVGSMVERSNHRVLMGDGCRVLRDISADYWSHAVALTLPRSVVRRLTRAGRSANAAMACDALADMIDADTLDDARVIVCDAIAGLTDYPVIDESDLSELEWETISSDEAWETVRDDMALAVARIITDANDSDTWEFADIMMSEDSDAFRVWFGQFISDHAYYPHCEDAVGSIHWEGIDDDAVKIIADTFTATGRFPWQPLPVTILPTVSLIKAYVTGSTWQDR
jgi:hypothetical protein